MHLNCVKGYMDGNSIALCRHYGCHGCSFKAIAWPQYYKKGKEKDRKNASRYYFTDPNYNSNATSCKYSFDSLLITIVSLITG